MKNGEGKYEPTAFLEGVVNEHTVTAKRPNAVRDSIVEVAASEIGHAESAMLTGINAQNLRRGPQLVRFIAAHIPSAGCRSSPNHCERTCFHLV
jgi:hypothetical protein